jgi:hypothetical protein
MKNLLLVLSILITLSCKKNCLEPNKSPEIVAYADIIPFGYRDEFDNYKEYKNPKIPQDTFAHETHKAYACFDVQNSENIIEFIWFDTQTGKVLSTFKNFCANINKQSVPHKYFEIGLIIKFKKPCTQNKIYTDTLKKTFSLLPLNELPIVGKYIGTDENGNQFNLEIIPEEENFYEDGILKKGYSTLSILGLSYQADCDKKFRIGFLQSSLYNYKILGVPPFSQAFQCDTELYQYGKNMISTNNKDNRITIEVSFQEENRIIHRKIAAVKQ